jgi:hypothetical protein
MTADEVEAALDALEDQGARAFDALACDCARTLLRRSDELSGFTAERLVERARAHVDGLRARFERERIRVESALRARVEQTGAHEDLDELVRRGDFATVARSLRRTRGRPRPRLRFAGFIEAPKQSSPQSSPPPPAGFVDPSKEPPFEPLRVRRRRARDYEDSVAELVASLALARAVDVVPEHAGPYNALRIASSVLDAMRELSPAYLTSQLNRLEELASLLALPELPDRQAAVRPLSPPKARRKLKS